MPQPQANWPMLNKIREWIDTADDWRQGAWYLPPETLNGATRQPSTIRGFEYHTDCGTAYCFAGYACHIAGDKFVVYQNDFTATRQPHVFSDGEVVTPEGRRVSIPRRARELLGITCDESDALFNGGNDKDDIDSVLDDIRERCPE